MYGDCEVVIPSSTMVGENGINPSSSSTTTDHHHHHHHHHNFHNLFCSSSSSPIRNPNSGFNFMMGSLPSFSLPFPPLISPSVKEEMGKEEMLESMSGSELNIEGQGGLSGNEFDSCLGGGYGGDLPSNTQQPPSKKKRYHRHTAHQIQEMESMFRECPHPDDKQRMKLSQELGLKPRQVKFWFQNRRTQMKAQQDRTDNVILRAENDNLKNENYRLQAVLKSLMCPSCGGSSILGEVEYDEQQLRIENARLKEEFDRVCALAARYSSGRPLQNLGPPPPPGLMVHAPPSLELDMSIYPRHFQDEMSNCPEMMPMSLLPDTSQFLSGNSGADHVGSGAGSGSGADMILDEERSLAMDLAMSSMDQLVKLCHANEPLWGRTNGNSMDVLNLEEYRKIFSWPVVDSLKQDFNELPTEATRDTTLVIMNSINLVDAFLDVHKWVELFPSIVSRARTIQILASGVSGHASGSLHLMYAEFQMLSPLVPSRETCFLRYCHQNIEEGTWAIVDFPIDNFHSLIQLSHQIPRYKRRPSGCIIQDMPNGYSKVTWVEHVEILEEKPTHQVFQDYVHSGMAFGAKRWLAVLQRQCERVASLMARNISDVGVIQSAEARKNFMKLSQRMIRTFCVNISTSAYQSWTALSESTDDTVRITTRKITEPGQPNGLILTAVSTTCLPFTHDHVFDLLKNERRRSQLEALSNGSSLHEVARIANGSHPGNCISLLRINVASNSSHNVELMLQESSTDSSGSLVVYTTMEVDYIQLVMSGEDPSFIPLLPTGFSIIPLEPTNSESGSDHPRCLLTVGLQVHASTIPNTKLNLSTITAINNHICNTVQQISAALSSSSVSTNNNADDVSAYAATINGSSSSSVPGSGSYPEPNSATDAAAINK